MLLLCRSAIEKKNGKRFVIMEIERQTIREISENFVIDSYIIGDI